MPMPMPHTDEERDEFMERCMGDGTMMEDFPDDDQRAAVCMTQWNDAHKSVKRTTRAYSSFSVKAVDEDQRILEGIATTPRTDRVEDVIESEGATFSLPLPLLWQHNSREPIGHVIAAEVSEDGIRVRAKLARIDVPGKLKERLDEAWHSLKLGLVRGLSIGFRALSDPEPIKGTFGLRFKKWEWLELSAVTIPANADASITAIKAADDRTRAATGTRVVRLSSPGASGNGSKRNPKESGADMTITERIGAYEAKRAANVARMQEITDKAGAEGRSKDESEREEFDTLRDEIKTIDGELVDLRDMEKLNVTKAKPVETTPNGKAGTESRTLVVKHPDKLEPGIEFARFVMCLAAAQGNTRDALNLAETHYPQQQRGINVLKASLASGAAPHRLIDSLVQTKAAVAGGTTTDATWALPLVEYNQFAGDFVEFLRAQTVIGKFGRNGIPDFRRIPFNVHIRGQTGGGGAWWTGEGKPKPVTSFAFNDAYHGFYKVAAITVLTEELIRFSNPSAEALVRDSLAEALVAKLDTDFLSLSVAAVSGVNPASITNGVAASGSTGNDADAINSDIATLWGTAVAANLPGSSAVYIMRPLIALRTGLLMNAFGQPAFPGLNMNGGTLGGVPVITSNYAPDETVILVFASEIWFSDDGVVTVDASREASIEMLDNPTNDTPTPTATTLVSMYQTDSVALRAHRFINWSKRRTQAVAVLNSVTWGIPASS